MEYDVIFSKQVKITVEADSRDEAKDKAAEELIRMNITMTRQDIDYIY